eukprot:jgi/Mesvir1/19044/Mv12806-RA.1
MSKMEKLAALLAKRLNKSVYAEREFWDTRHAEGEIGSTTDANNEWYVGYEKISQFLSDHIPSKDAAVLEIGCGMSRLSLSMAADGYRNLQAVDYSEVCIERLTDGQEQELQRRANGNAEPSGTLELSSDGAAPGTSGPREHKHPPCRVNFQVMDIRKMSFADSTFAAVIDKGLLDTLLNSNNSAQDVGAALREVHRVLAPGGRYLLFTHSEVEARREHLMLGELGWTLAGSHPIQKNMAVFHLHVLQK